jgi:hypothetical protein
MALSEEDYNKLFFSLLSASKDGVVEDDVGNKFRLEKDGTITLLTPKSGQANEVIISPEKRNEVILNLTKQQQRLATGIEPFTKPKKTLTGDITQTARERLEKPQGEQFRFDLQPSVDQLVSAPTEQAELTAGQAPPPPETKERKRIWDANVGEFKYSEVTPEQVAKAQTRKDTLAFGIVGAMLISNKLDDYDVSIKNLIGRGKVFTKKPPPEYIQFLKKRIKEYKEKGPEGLSKEVLFGAQRALRSTKKQIAELQERQAAAQAAGGTTQFDAGAIQQEGEELARVIGQAMVGTEAGLSAAAIESAARQEAQFREDLADVSRYEVGVQQAEADTKAQALQMTMLYLMKSPLKVAPIA